MRVRVSPIVTVGLMMTAACLVLYVSDCSLARTLANQFQDAVIAITCRPERAHQVVIVEIDDESIAELGQWPWPRYLVAKLTSSILAKGATVVAFDVLFAEPDRTSPEALVRDLQRHLGVEAVVQGVPPELYSYDAILASAVKGQNVILGCSMLPVDPLGTNAPMVIDPYFRSQVVYIGKGGGRRSLLQARDAILPMPELNAHAYIAFFNAVTDADNIVRRNPLVWAVGGSHSYPALALEAVRLHLEAGPSVVRYDDQGILDVKVGDFTVPVDFAGRMVLNYRSVTTNSRTGLSGSFPSFPAVDVLSGRVGTNAFSGRIVLVGASAAGLKDIKATPLTSHFSGVEVHATMIDNILARDVLRCPTWMLGADACAVLLVGLVLTAGIARGRAWMSFSIGTTVLLASSLASYMCVTRASLLFLPAWSMICVAVVYPILTTMRFWIEERQKHKVREMFGTMVSAKVLRYLENHPERFSLRGERTEATVFFSDVRGFTTISESLAPERLTELLNRYLSPMTEIIMRYDGYVDKYEGDAIMAEWGVPFAVTDHAVNACLAALEQQAVLAALRPELEAEYGYALHVRMGINTGALTAGNMGANNRFQYTVMGDTVNQAARLEPANKDYGTSIIIGEATFRMAAAHIHARLLDRIVVMGKTQAVTIYELLGRRGEVEPARLAAAQCYERALELYWKRDWAGALDALKEALAHNPDDGPSGVLQQRIRDYQAEPPPDDWQGEYRRLSKD